MHNMPKLTLNAKMLSLDRQLINPCGTISLTTEWCDVHQAPCTFRGERFWVQGEADAPSPIAPLVMQNRGKLTARSFHLKKP